MRVVDFRSDTVTHPTPEMRRAMAEAEVGDMSRGDDPTVNRLEAMSAERTGKEAAMFVASGTMGNLVSILAHTQQRGDEIIIGDRSHIFRSEYAGAAALGGVSYHTLPNDSRGMLDPDQVEAAIQARSTVPFPRTAMVAFENTQNAVRRRSADGRGHQGRRGRGPPPRRTSAYRRRPDIQCLRLPGNSGLRARGRGRQPELLPLQRTERPRRLASMRKQRVH